MMKVIEKIKNKQCDINANEPVTIVFLGDSVTQGCFECYLTGPDSLQTVFDYPSAYSTRIKEIFNILYPSVQVNILNSGISGDGTKGGIVRIERDVLRYNPDLVVVSYGLNDAALGGMADIDGYGARLKQLFNQITDSGAECIFLTENMMNTNTSVHLKDKLFIALAEHFAKVENDGVLQAYFEKAKEVANQNGVKVCDCYAKWKAMQKGGVEITEMLANKLNHPIRPLHYLFAYSLMETIFEL